MSNNNRKIVRTKKRLNYCALSLWLLVAFVFLNIMRMLASNRLATMGDKLISLEAAEKVLEISNRAMVNSIGNFSSMSSVEKRAHKIGFVAQANLLTLSPEQVVAMNSVSFDR